MDNYTSQGTIRCEISRNKNDPKTTIFFAPERDYSIKHRTKDYAVFVLQPCNKAIIVPDKGEGIKICTAKFDSTDVILRAAACQAKVEVKVKVKKIKTPGQCPKLELTSITVPATGPAK